MSGSGKEEGRKEGRRSVSAGERTEQKREIFLIGFAAEEAASAVNDRTSSAGDSRN